MSPHSHQWILSSPFCCCHDYRFAGAGLFDSVPTTPTQTVLLDYSREPLALDRTAAAELLWRCAAAAVAAEEVVDQYLGQDADLHGSDRDQNLGQDVEGCVTADGKIWLLQDRPQV